MTNPLDFVCSACGYRVCDCSEGPRRGARRLPKREYDKKVQRPPAPIIPLPTLPFPRIPRPGGDAA